jgi:hypothetical protein
MKWVDPDNKKGIRFELLKVTQIAHMRRNKTSML